MIPSDSQQFVSHRRRLVIHHIDYDKKNSKESNLITLCNFCNISVNRNRKEWTKYFQEMASKSKT